MKEQKQHIFDLEPEAMTPNKALDDVGADDLQNLIAAKEAEKQTVDYKQAIHLDIQHNKDEFRRDISSFANASGGDYILGIREEQGVPVEMQGMSINNPDAFKLRLEELLQSHIRPRIPGIQIRPIELPNGAFTTVVRIPKSFARPHQVTINKDDYQFWSRNAAGKYRLDVDQLRTAFLLSETLEERVRNFRRGRLGDIVAGETPLPMSSRPKLVLHLVPLNAFDVSSGVNVSQLSERDMRSLWPLYTSSMNSRYNFDGVLNYYERSGITASYVQLFRNGIVEAVEDDLPAFEEQKILRATHCEEELLKAMPKYLNFQRDLGIDSPILVMLSLLGVKGYTMPTAPTMFRMQSHSIERDSLIVPEIVIETDHSNLHTLLRPVFDTVWNAGGHSSCPNYDQSGNWQAQDFRVSSF